MAFLRTLFLILLHALALALFLFIVWLNLKAFYQVFRSNAGSTGFRLRRTKLPGHGVFSSSLVNCLLAAISFLIGLLLCEFILHSFVSVKKLGFSEPSFMYRFHPRLLCHLNPDLPGTQQVGGVTIFEPKVDRKKTRFRILILGDSYSQSSGTDNHWPNTIRLLLRKASLEHQVEVVNAAVAGYSAWQEKISLKILAPVLKPDLVVATWVPNDNSDDIIFVGEGLPLQYPGDLKELHSEEGSGFGPVETFLINNSRFYQLLLKWVFPKFQKPGSNQIVGRFFLSPPDWLEKSMVEHHLRQLREIRQLAVDHGANFCQVFFGFVTQNFPFACRNADHCGKENLGFLLSYGPQSYLKERMGLDDSLNAIKELGKPLHPALIWSDFGHFDSLGQRRIAAIVLRYLAPRLPLSDKQSRQLREVLSAEEDWFASFNTPLCRGDFGDHPRLVPHRTEGIADEPPTYRLKGDLPFVIFAKSPEGFKRGKDYYLTIDGYTIGELPEIAIYQGKKCVFNARFGYWAQQEALKTVPKSIKFRVGFNTEAIEIKLVPSPGSETILRSWVISSGDG